MGIAEIRELLARWRIDGAEGDRGGPVVIGENGFHYRALGENWGQIAEGCVYKEGIAVAVDYNDEVYVFNRGTIPMLVFGTNGNLLRTCGEGVFANPHGVTIAPGDNAPNTAIFPGLGPAQISRRIHAAVKHAGLAGYFSGHSGRVRMAARMATHSAPTADLMRQGRWKSPTMVTRYTRAVEAGAAGEWL